MRIKSVPIKANSNKIIQSGNFKKDLHEGKETNYKSLACMNNKSGYTRLAWEETCQAKPHTMPVRYNDVPLAYLICMTH